MDNVKNLIDQKVLDQLIKDIGKDNARLFLSALDDEFQMRINNLSRAVVDKSHTSLEQEAHALKSCALSSGAAQLAGELQKLEIMAKNGEEGAFDQVKDVLTLAELTRFAYLELKFD